MASMEGGAGLGRMYGCSGSNVQELCFKNRSSKSGPLWGPEGPHDAVPLPYTALCRRDPGGRGSPLHAARAAAGPGAGPAGAQAPAARLHAHRSADHHLLLLAHGHHRYFQGGAGVYGAFGEEAHSASHPQEPGVGEQLGGGRRPARGRAAVL